MASPPLGTTGFQPFLSLASAPSTAFEWIALLPLIIHLASFRHAHKLVGKIALTGEISVPFLPRLGVLSSISDLLIEGSDFLDRACSISELRREVWDVNWGSVFPCANGAASDLVTKRALKGSTLVDVEERIDQVVLLPQGAKGSKATLMEIATPPKSKHRRFQTLHLIKCTRLPPGKPFTEWRLKRTTMLSDIFLGLTLLGCMPVCILFGLFGTLASITIAFFFLLCRRCILVQRASDYMLDNEAGHVPGCMLVSIHENASSWYLYTGERGIIDNLLNKPMIFEITSIFGKRGSTVLAFCLRLLGVLQLLSMTYVASQKGWDGIALFVFISVAWVCEWAVYGEVAIAKRWLRHSNIEMKAVSFKFGGRTAMIGAIQLFKNNPVFSWMDTILAPCKRREIWLQRLQEYRNIAGDSKGATASGSIDENMATTEPELSGHDQEWVSLNLRLSTESVKILHQECTKFEEALCV